MEENNLTPAEQFAQKANAPQRVTTDAGTVEQFDLDDQIKADKYRRASEFADSKNRGLGIKLFKISPGGSNW